MSNQLPQGYQRIYDLMHPEGSLTDSQTDLLMELFEVIAPAVDGVRKQIALTLPPLTAEENAKVPDMLLQQMDRYHALIGSSVDPSVQTQNEAKLRGVLGDAFDAVLQDAGVKIDEAVKGIVEKKLQ